MVYQIVVVIYRSEILDVYWFAGVVFVVFVPHCEAALFADVAFYVYIALRHLKPINLFLILIAIIQLFVARPSNLKMLVIAHSNQLLFELVLICKDRFVGFLNEIQNVAHFVEVVSFAADVHLREHLFELGGRFGVENALAGFGVVVDSFGVDVALGSAASFFVGLR